MKLLLNCYTSENYDGCRRAFLDLTPELAAKIMARKAQFEAIAATDSDITTLVFYGCEPAFLSGLPVNLGGEEQYDEYQDEDFVETDAAPEDFENLVERTECDRMVIAARDFYWVCQPKHTGEDVETRPIEYAMAEKALAAGGVQ